jgi:hypothetical protein
MNQIVALPVIENAGLTAVLACTSELAWCL